MNYFIICDLIQQIINLSELLQIFQIYQGTLNKAINKCNNLHPAHYFLPNKTETSNQLAHYGSKKSQNYNINNVKS